MSPCFKVVHLRPCKILAQNVYSQWRLNRKRFYIISKFQFHFQISNNSYVGLLVDFSEIITKTDKAKCEYQNNENHLTRRKMHRHLSQNIIKVYRGKDFWGKCLWKNGGNMSYWPYDLKLWKSTHITKLTRTIIKYILYYKMCVIALYVHNLSVLKK